LLSFFEVFEAFEGAGEGAFSAAGGARLRLADILGATDIASLLKAAACFSR
jgi:hypothetical protein